jgi:transcriptional regulator with XRE-family HTH domain
MKSVGKLLRDKRVLLKMTQQSLSEKEGMGYSHKQAISNFERGFAVIPLSKILPFSKHLEIPLITIVNSLCHDYRKLINEEIAKYKAIEDAKIKVDIELTPPIEGN